MDIDTILQDSSKAIFSNLESYHILILIQIARQGPQSATQIEDFGFHHPSIGNFNRWELKRRLEGSHRFMGLIPFDYIQKIKINKKETRYGLTLKGFLACLSLLEFDRIYLIKRYREILMKYSNNDSKTVEAILQYIKNEVAYLLYYNYIQGINWLKFRFLRQYVEKLRISYRGNFHLYFEFDRSLLNKTEKSTFEWLERKYGKSYQLARLLMGWVDPDKVFKIWTKKLKNESIFDPKIKKIISLYLYGRLWHVLIDNPKREMNDSQLVGTYLDLEGFDMRPHILKMSKKDRDTIFRHKIA